jgi:hypothetical protein
MADSRRKIERFPQIVSSKEKRAEPEASHSARRFCGRRFVALGFDLLVFGLLAGDTQHAILPSKWLVFIRPFVTGFEWLLTHEAFEPRISSNQHGLNPPVVSEKKCLF